jgi:hypothetical protein
LLTLKKIQKDDALRVFAPLTDEALAQAPSHLCVQQSAAQAAPKQGA